jgi:hypothetical protein
MPTRTYKVVGTSPILDHKPGETFEADLDETNESYLIGIGGIARQDKPIEDEVKRLNVQSYTVNAPREERKD